MNKKIIAAAAIAACSSVSQAQSNVTIYGDIDQYIGYISSSSGKNVIGLNDGSILRSRLGFRGTEELGHGYQVKYTLEQGLNAGTGASADSNHLFDRQAWVGISTPVGEFRLGRQNTEIFYIGGAIDYTDRTTFGSVINTFGVPSRYDNDISYKSPRIAGFQGVAHYALGEQAGGGLSQSAVVQLALDYTNGPYRAGYAGLSAKPAPTGTVQEKIVYHNLYADYEYGSGKVYVAYVRSNNVTSNANGLTAGTILSNIANPNNLVAGTDKNAYRYFNIYQLSADYRISSQVRVGALYGVIKDTSDTSAGAKGGNIGVFYDLSKRTILYSFASVLTNQSNAGFRFSGSAGPTANLAGADVNGQRLSGVQAGVVHKF
ncbi:porin [Undibacterium sp. RuRC25W]|uniref:porin n=1 Tax=Undibacterium sp. RuRC25W TaxID=3413047 RepID=UPI003BEF5623